MNRLATAIRYDPSSQGNTRLYDLTVDFKSRDNAAFLAEVARQLDELAGKPDGQWLDRTGAGCIGLIGAYGLGGATIRQAQSAIRVDRAASYWSHAFFITGGLSPVASQNADPRTSAWIWESTLEPAQAFAHYSDRAGVAARHVSDYVSPSFEVTRRSCVPNIAVVAIGLTDDERKRIHERGNDPNVDQLSYDLSTLLGVWYAYIADSALHPNPLAEGHALHSSAFVQLAYDAVGIDLAPGAHQKNIAPEHIWQMAKYLYSELKTVDAQGTIVERPVYGWYCVREPAAFVTPPETPDQRFPRTLEDAMRAAVTKGL